MIANAIVEHAIAVSMIMRIQNRMTIFSGRQYVSTTDKSIAAARESACNMNSRPKIRERHGENA